MRHNIVIKGKKMLKLQRTKGYNTLHLNQATLKIIMQDWFDSQWIKGIRVVGIKHPDNLTTWPFFPIQMDEIGIDRDWETKARLSSYQDV